MFLVGDVLLYLQPLFSTHVVIAPEEYAREDFPQDKGRKDEDYERLCEQKIYIHADSRANMHIGQEAICLGLDFGALMVFTPATNRSERDKDINRTFLHHKTRVIADATPKV